MTPLPPLERCHTKEQIAGKEQAAPPWDAASITMMAEAHLLHEQPNCPFDDTPITALRPCRIPDAKPVTASPASTAAGTLN